MSYNNNYGGQGYGQYDPYSSRQDNRYNNDVEAGTGRYEMSQYDPPIQGGYDEPNDKRAILNQCKDIEQGIDEVERYIEQIQGLYRRLLTDADPTRENAIRSQADGLANDAKRLYQNLVQRLKGIKQTPGSGESINSAQIGRVERKLKSAITNFHAVQSDFRKDLEAQMARQYRIVRPDATDEEVKEAVQDPSQQQIFSQALMQSDRRGDAQKVSQMVRARHDEILKIERDLLELSQMFQDLDAIVIQQEAAVERIDDQTEQIHNNITKGNEEIGGAIKKARARNKKKWICLGIVVLIILVLVLFFAIYFTVGPGGSKSSGK
ncbi:syntaxin family protein [Histoplasma capsulatum G186AR]|uniref:Syntaxin family protein n=1 Tax=Ajellomyces capsulatus TaxID=5037 RepID=A0A8H8D0J9_AJECA|nr:syntaxin family protein [Histoplasma capsulatum]QSS74490.1 syntaxin family protein [Histoplasma capsulatum G186AR]